EDGEDQNESGLPRLDVEWKGVDRRLGVRGSGLTSTRTHLKPSALLLSAFAVILVVLAAGLRPDAFFVGDPGIKLILAKNAIASPNHPLDLPLPIIGQERLPYVEPFFEVHGDHAHAVTTDLFPLLSARAIQWFGLRGAYILPAAGFLGILLGCA